MAEEQRHIIEPERLGLWVAAGFTLALIAFVTAFISLNETKALLVGTQLEVLALDKRIGNIEKKIGDIEKGQKTAAQAAQQDFVSRAPTVQKAYDGYSLGIQRLVMLALAESTGLEYAGK